MTLHAQIEQIVGAAVKSASRLQGGMIGDVQQVDLSDGRQVVAKTDTTGDAMLEREGAMLRYLQAHSQLPVPEVYHSDEHLLLMDFIEGDSRFDNVAEASAADHLAGLHNVTGKAFGLEQPTLIGGLHQPNPQMDSWVAFFRDHRLLYMAQVANEAGRLPGKIRQRIETFAGQLDRYLEEPKSPSLVHGDVWTTNVLAKDGEITAFLDPAIYYAHPEIELAFITLFNTFGEQFFQRYEQHRPISPGFFEERRDIYNLYPLLVHVRLFGGGYVRSVQGILSKFGV